MRFEKASGKRDLKSSRCTIARNNLLSRASMNGADR